MTPTPLVGCKWDSRLPHLTMQKLRQNSLLKLQSLSCHKSQCHGWENSPLPSRWHLTSHLSPRPTCNSQTLVYKFPIKDGPALWGPDMETRSLQMSASCLPEGRQNTWALPPGSGAARFLPSGLWLLWFPRLQNQSTKAAQYTILTRHAPSYL